MRLMKEALLQEVRNREQKQYALQFDGVSGWVGFPQSQNMIDNIDNFDHDIIINASTTEIAGIGTLWNSGYLQYDGYNNDIILYGYYNNVGFRLYTRNPSEGIPLNKVLTSDKTEIKASFVGEDINCYIDDIFVLTKKVYDKLNSKIMLGGSVNVNDQNPSRFWLKGLIYDFKIIQQPTGLVVLDCDFSTGSGTTLFDKSGNNNHGTLHGGVQWV